MKFHAMLTDDELEFGEPTFYDITNRAEAPQGRYGIVSRRYFGIVAETDEEAKGLEKIAAILKELGVTGIAFRDRSGKPLPHPFTAYPPDPPQITFHVVEEQE